MKQFKAFHTPGKDTTMRKILLSIIALTIFSTSYSAFANVTVIEGSYIVTFKKEAGAVPLIQVPDEANRGKVPFGQSSTGQSKSELAATLGTTGEVVSIFASINAVHIKMDAKEADRLSRDKRVLHVEQDRVVTPQTSQANPGWGLDRLDSPTPALDNYYNYSNTGAGRTIYILDSGLALSNPTVAAEFGGRASIIYDASGGTGDDCSGHGTAVASAAGGNTMGVAKGATLAIARIADAACINNISTSVFAFDWLTLYAPKGTIVNYSQGLEDPNGTCSPVKSPALETSITNAHNAGVIIVVAAGNDGCNTDNYSPVNIPQSFVVGATHYGRLPGVDAMAYFSRTGWNISTFAPGHFVQVMGRNGVVFTTSGTSISAPYIAGIFAIACQAAGTYCDSGNTAGLYTDLRNTGTLGTVTNNDGTPLSGATSRFIRQQW